MRQFAEIVVQCQLDALMLCRAQSGPADGIVDVLQLIIKINVESRQLRFEYGIIIAGTDLIGVRFFRL